MATTSTTTGTISSPGLSSGLDVSGIISQLVALERRPIQQLESEVSTLNAKLSSWGQIKSSLSSLRDASNALNNADTWAAKRASSGNESAVKVTADASAAVGSYSIEVLDLAAAQSLATSSLTPYASPTSTVGQGTLTIQMGRWNATQDDFTADADRAALNITIGPGEDTLEGIRDKINAAGGEVTASIVTDTSGSRLVLRGPSGAANGFTVTSADAGLAALTYDPEQGINNMEAAQTAADSRVRVNGLLVSSQTNSVSAVDGLTLKLAAKTTAAVDVAVEADTESISKAISTFATAYSSLATLIKDQTAYNAATESGATLQGDGTARNLQQQLRSLIGGVSGASSVYARLADIGLDPQANGTLSVNSSKLDEALASGLAEVKRLFANLSPTDATQDGFAQRMRTLTDGVLGTEGAVTTRTAGIQSTISRNEKRQEELEDRVAAVEARLRAQYTALDTTLARLNSLSSYVTQQLAVLNSNSGS